MSGYREKAPGAVSSLVLGILGIVICGLLAPIAWYQGKEAEAIARRDGLDGEGMATAGKVLGIVGTVLLVLGIFAIFIFVAVGASWDSVDFG